MFFKSAKLTGVYYVLVDMTDEEFNEIFDTYPSCFTVRRISKLTEKDGFSGEAGKNWHYDIKVIMDGSTYTYWSQDGEIHQLNKPNPKKPDITDEYSWNMASKYMEAYGK
jgi:hypothetical protein